MFVCFIPLSQKYFKLLISILTIYFTWCVRDDLCGWTSLSTRWSLSRKIKQNDIWYILYLFSWRVISVFLTCYIGFLKSNIYFAAFCISFHDVKYLFSWLVLSVFLTCYVCFLICYICSLDVWCHVCWSVIFTIINHTCRYNRFWFSVTY